MHQLIFLVTFMDSFQTFFDTLTMWDIQKILNAIICFLGIMWTGVYYPIKHNQHLLFQVFSLGFITGRISFLFVLFLAIFLTTNNLFTIPVHVSLGFPKTSWVKNPLDPDQLLNIVFIQTFEHQIVFAQLPVVMNLLFQSTALKGVILLLLMLFYSQSINVDSRG